MSVVIVRMNTTSMIKIQSQQILKEQVVVILNKLNAYEISIYHSDIS